MGRGFYQRPLQSLAFALTSAALTLGTTACFKKLGDDALKNGDLGIALKAQDRKRIVNPGAKTEIQVQIAAPGGGSELNGIPVVFKKLPSGLNAGGKDDSALECRGIPSDSCEVSSESLTSVFFKAATDPQVKSEIEATLVGSRTAVRILVEVNQGPTGITLDTMSIPESTPTGTAISTLATVDANIDDTFSYALVDSKDYPDNELFFIAGSKLKLKAALDYESRSNPYTVRVRTKDANNLTFDQTLSLAPTNVNEAPTDISLSSSTVTLTQASLTAVGSLSSTDQDLGESFTYSLVPGEGAADNSSFLLSGNSLVLSASVFGQCRKDPYSVRVRSTDQGGLFFEKVFSIRVDQPPTVISYPKPSLSARVGIPIADQTPNTPCGASEYSIEPNLPDGLRWDSKTGTISGSPTQRVSSPVTHTITAKNSAGSGSTTVSISVRDPKVVISKPSPSGTVPMGSTIRWSVEIVDAGVTLNETHLKLGGTATEGCTLKLSSAFYYMGSPVGNLRYVDAEGCSAKTGTLNLSVNAGAGVESDSQTPLPAAGPSEDVIFASPIVRFEKTDLILAESTSSSTPVRIAVTITPKISVATRIFYSVSNAYNSGVSASDTALQSGTLLIGANQSSATLSFNLPSDVLASPSKLVQVSLSGAISDGSNSGGVIGMGAEDQVRIKIRDRDGGSPDFTTLSVGTSHACGITSSGTLKCWGDNSSGQLGDGSTLSRSSPITIDGSTSYRAVAAGLSHTCGITSSGTLKCWGSNTWGQIGDGGATTNRLLPSRVDPFTSYQAITAGSNHSCGISASGQLKCWGQNGSGQLGNGNFSGWITPTIIDIETRYQQIDAGYSSTCGITTTGALKCWGSGPLGRGDNSSSNFPVLIDAGVLFKSISTGDYTSCGVTEAGVLKCWGSNYPGTPLLIPTVVDPGVEYLSASSGEVHQCGVTSLGFIKCWGISANGRLGDGVNGNYTPSTPTLVDSNTSFISVQAGGAFSCGITSSGAVKCWGNNKYGQLGQGVQTQKVGPTLIDGGAGYSQLSAGRYHTCAISSSGSLKCWGTNTYGQLGDGSTQQRTSPVLVDAATNYRSIAVGKSHTCGITSANILKCWGYNGSGQLGDGSRTNRTIPVIIDRGTSYQSIATSFDGEHTCGITSTNILKCWGYNHFGQVGNGKSGTSGPTKLAHEPSPVLIDSGTSYSAVGTGQDHTCGITTQNVLKCWGSNSDGQLGSSQSSTSTPIVIGSSYLKISLGKANTCGISTSGTLGCWGQGAYTGPQKQVVVSYSAVTAGDTHTCAITSQGALRCWGQNFFGQLGDGSTEAQSYPVGIDVNTLYQSISAGATHTCGITQAGALKCWGDDERGILGRGLPFLWPSAIAD
ncbi:MAG: putative Ig domain-containing protein [Bdellovibrionales bacterium]|nr:putative Ig domain-containing protein [Bdellovibrionales bacterium]